MRGRQTFFATCSPGVEPALHAEVRELGFGRSERQVGGVLFGGTVQDAWRANLWLRTAVRVLWRLARFPAPDAAALYAGVAGIDWSRLVRPDGTLLVDAQCRSSALTHSRFAAQRVKDAIVDQVRARTGRRPSVQRDDPDLRVHLHLHRDRATVSLDTSGDSLHKRGWRRHQGAAPLAETLAAALVRLSGWDGRAPLLDPFCGSGTIVVEAALQAGHVAPGLFRERFGFERWPGHDAAAFARLREKTRAAQRWPAKLRVHGQDRDPAQVAGARDNAAAAGVAPRVHLDIGDLAALPLRRGWNAWIVTNPPWGERVGERSDLRALYASFGRMLRERCRGYGIAVLSADPCLTRALGLPACERVELVHGGIATELVTGRVA